MLHLPRPHGAGSAVGQADRARQADRRLRRRGPHPHVHPGLDEHPWRALPIALALIVVLAVVLIVVSFALSKAIAGRAY